MGDPVECVDVDTVVLVYIQDCLDADGYSCPTEMYIDLSSNK